jgi:hypothetical protein
MNFLFGGISGYRESITCQVVVPEDMGDTSRGRDKVTGQGQTRLGTGGQALDDLRGWLPWTALRAGAHARRQGSYQGAPSGAAYGALSSTPLGAAVTVVAGNLFPVVLKSTHRMNLGNVLPTTDGPYRKPIYPNRMPAWVR